MPGTGTSTKPATVGSVSAGIAAASALLAKSAESALRFPGEDGGRSLVEMAHADLDATLQLLAERAQYITGASGAAIALRRDDQDMLCRASSGENAPELGALLSMEYGLSGESVRTRQLMRCDDTERDPRVNRDVCRELRIASVLVMPILADGEVLGVFELFSSKPGAFDERDLSALLRLSEMVAASVMHAAAPYRASPIHPAASARGPLESPIKAEKTTAQRRPAPHDPDTWRQAASDSNRPLFWSAAMRADAAASAQESATNVPPVLRDLKKCQACGFPVSQERVLCVECEEKRWRGPSPLDEAMPQKDQDSAENGRFGRSSVEGVPAADFAPPSNSTSSDTARLRTWPTEIPGKENPERKITHELEGDASGRSKSWLSPDHYFLAALLIVAAVLAVVAWIR